MTRTALVSFVTAVAVAGSFAASGFPRAGIAGLLTAIVLIASEAPRAALLAGAAVSAGLIVALAA